MHAEVFLYTGQFWNVPIQVQPYTGPVQDGVNSDGYVQRHNNQPSQRAKAIFRRLTLAPNLGVQDGVLSMLDKTRSSTILSTFR